MKSILAKKIREIFSEEIAKSLPMFKALSPTETKAKIPAGDRLYLWDYSEDLHFYLLLCIASEKMGDAFTIEGLFTKYREFPVSKGLSYPYGVPKSDIHPSVPISGSMRFRIGYLFHDPSDFWWWVRPNPTFKESSTWYQLSVTDDTVFMPEKMSEEEAIQNIRKLVQDAISKIKEYLLPFFEEIINEYKSVSDYWGQFENLDLEKEKRT